jgi:hypothetical protein
MCNNNSRIPNVATGIPNGSRPQAQTGTCSANQTGHQIQQVAEQEPLAYKYACAKHTESDSEYSLHGKLQRLKRWHGEASEQSPTHITLWNKPWQYPRTLETSFKDSNQETWQLYWRLGMAHIVIRKGLNYLYAFSN